MLALVPIEISGRQVRIFAQFYIETGANFWNFGGDMVPLSIECPLGFNLGCWFLFILDLACGVNLLIKEAIIEREW